MHSRFGAEILRSQALPQLFSVDRREPDTPPSVNDHNTLSLAVLLACPLKHLSMVELHPCDGLINCRLGVHLA